MHLPPRPARARWLLHQLVAHERHGQRGIRRPSAGAISSPREIKSPAFRRYRLSNIVGTTHHLHCETTGALSGLLRFPLPLDSLLLLFPPPLLSQDHEGHGRSGGKARGYFRNAELEMAGDVVSRPPSLDFLSNRLALPRLSPARARSRTRTRHHSLSTLQLPEQGPRLPTLRRPSQLNR